MKISAGKRGWLLQLLTAVLFVASLWLVRADVQAGMNDDWSFARIAGDLAATGHLHYNGWAAPLMGFQAYWAALFIKLFGFSFFTVRASVWLLTLLAIPVLWRLLLAVGIAQAQAFAGLNFFLLSPLVLPNSATFMTDLPAFYLFCAALGCGLKVWRADTETSSMAWSAALTVCAILSGSVRQIYWLSGVCFLVTLAWHRMRSRRERMCIFMCLVCTMTFGAIASSWLAHQPYVPADTTLEALRQLSWRQIADESVVNSIRSFIGLAVVSVPFTLPLAWRGRRRIWPIQLTILCVSLAIAYWVADPDPWVGNTITNYGVIMSGTVSIGDKPEILSHVVMISLAVFGLASALYALMEIVEYFRRRTASNELLRFTWLTVPFLMLYVVVLMIRAPAFGLYDRYFIPHLFVILTVALAIYGRRSLLAFSAGGIFVLYAVATTHDYFAEARAKLIAADEVLKAGHDRTQVLSGFEFDSWTQMQRTGYVNNSQVKFPANAYHQDDDCNGSDDLQAWWRPMVPALKARYVVTLTPIHGLNSTAFPSVHFWRWIPPGLNHVYVEEVGEHDPALTCKPDTEN